MDVRGGVRRDGWYGLGTGNKKLVRKGVPMQARLEHILSMTDVAQYDVALTVQPAAGPPYEVQGLFVVPDDAVGRLEPGMTLPVRVHPSKPKRVAIDWPAFEASPSTS